MNHGSSRIGSLSGAALLVSSVIWCFEKVGKLSDVRIRRMGWVDVKAGVNRDNATEGYSDSSIREKNSRIMLDKLNDWAFCSMWKYSSATVAEF